MTLDELEQSFTKMTSDEAKIFLKHNLKKLAEKQLLGKFYKLYARTHLRVEKDTPSYDELNSPLLKGGEK